MIARNRSSRWAAALALGLSGLVSAGVASVSTAPVAHGAVSAFELTIEGRDWLEFHDEEILLVRRQATFTSRAPFCSAGTLAELDEPGVRGAWRLTCGDGTGSLTISAAPRHGPAPWPQPLRSTRWQILDGSGAYADLRGRGSLSGDEISYVESTSGAVFTWQSVLEGVADKDRVAPSIDIASVSASKLARPAGMYSIRLDIRLRDNVVDNPVSYTVRASARGRELARKLGTARSEVVSMALHVRPRTGTRTIRISLTAWDPVGHTVSVRRALALPR